MMYESHNQTAFRRRAVDRVGQVSEHLTSRPGYAREHIATSRTQSNTGTPSFLHRQNGLPTSLAPTPVQSPTIGSVSLPSFKHMAEVADHSNLQYMRAPSVGSEYIPVPLIRTESSYVSPPESVFSPTPTPSRSVTPTMNMARMSLSVRPARRQSPSYRVEKKSKPAKRKDMSTTARAQELENNRRIDAAQRPYKEGVQTSLMISEGNGRQRFPRFDRPHAPREAKRAKIVTGSSDPNTRHNVAQTHLRAEKGGSRMVLQRLLISGLNWKGRKIQTFVNAKSSGMLYEEKDTLQASTKLIAFAIFMLQGIFEAEGMQQLCDILDLFEPEDVQPAVVMRDPRDDDKTYDLKCQAARIQVIEEAHLPLGLKNVRSQDELLQIVQQKLMPIADDFGKVALRQMFFRRPREHRAMF
ncbi:unnamed protein product [Aureobasidium uvarum]|uniref:Uncharacterized protein n=1 Tax=Aureobasidium uvarum TaxID=2773716 RepID=A0A9N8KHR1_9PEZI|nr:unnamed protein product [Aureobasidium uvarum]